MVHTDVERLNGCSAGTGYSTCVHACSCFDSSVFGWCVKMMTKLMRSWNICACWGGADATLILACSQAWSFVLWRIWPCDNAELVMCFRSGPFSILGGQGLSTKNLVRAKKMLGGGGSGGRGGKRRIYGGKIPWKHARNWRIQEAWDWGPPSFTIIAVEVLTRTVVNRSAVC